MDQVKVSNRSTKGRASAVQLARVALIGLLLALLPRPQTTATLDRRAPKIDSNLAAKLLGIEPTSLTIADSPGASQLWTLTEPTGRPVGFVARTLPAASDAIGYRGPTEAALVLDTKLTVVQATMLSSEDTPEHVRAVRDNDRFLSQFRGLQFGSVDPAFHVDGVSGATLTSLAMAKGILLRLGGQRPSLFFPDELELDKLQSWKLSRGQLEDALQQHRLMRTGPVSDDVVGYQGPSEAAVLIDTDARVQKIKLVRSFDNQPYVGYVEDDRYYWTPFIGKTLAEVAHMNLAEEGIEGISGATMTSMAATETVIAAAKKWTEPKPAPKATHATIRWSVHEIATVAVVGLTLLASFAKLFRYPYVRTVWLVLVVVVVGFWTGNLVSLALIAGWSMEGVAWQLAPGLAMIGLLALVAPPLSKGNPYCNHLCPHGALQQLIRPAGKSNRKFTVPKKLERLLLWLPGTLLTAAYVAILFRPNVNLARWEPFQAYLIRIASWSTIGLALVSLIIASMIPMAYCRYGCATGRLLDYLRRSAKSHKLTFADAVVATLVVAATVLQWRTK